MKLRNALVVGIFFASQALAGGLGSRSSFYEYVYTPALTTSAYSAGTFLSTGASTISGVGFDTSQAITLSNVTVVDANGRSSAKDLVFLDRPLSAPDQVAAAANTTPQLAASVLLNGVVGQVNIPAANYVTHGVQSIASVKNVGMTFRLATGSRNLYMYAIERGTPTYSANSSVKIKLEFLQN